MGCQCNENEVQVESGEWVQSVFLGGCLAGLIQYWEIYCIVNEQDKTLAEP
jgi:hypothetical protein